MPEKNRIKTYYHLDNSVIAKIPEASVSANLSRMFSESYRPHRFYEGTMTHQGKDLIFCLEKSMGTIKDRNELAFALTEILIGRMEHRLSLDRDVIGHERFEHFLEAKELFRKYQISQDLVGKADLMAVRGLYQRFSENADVIVPGYILGISIDGSGRILSQVEPVSIEERPQIETKLRARNLKGLIEFRD